MKEYNLLIDGGVIKEGHYVLRSKNHSDKYIDKDKIILIPELFNLITTRLKGLIYNKVSFDCIISPAIAGICFGSPIAIKLGLPFVYPEKVYGGCCEPGDYTFQFRSSFEEYLKGKKVIVVEDIITTALSVMKTIEAIYKCGGEVGAVYCIWNRNPEIKSINVWKTNLKGKSKIHLSTSEAAIESKEIPVHSLVSKKVESWEPEDCPLCKKGIPLIDPKTGKNI